MLPWNRFPGLHLLCLIENHSQIASAVYVEGMMEGKHFQHNLLGMNEQEINVVM